MRPSHLISFYLLTFKIGLVEAVVDKFKLFDPQEAYFEVFGSNFSTNPAHHFETGETSPTSRKLLGAKSCGIDSDQEPCCVTCDVMQYCSILEGIDIEEKYVPGDFTSLLSCSNLDDRLGRLDIWGALKSEKTFRDSETCRDMVLDYTCRFWVNMHTNRCDPDSGPQIKTPCRSYCSTLATTCANTLDYLDLCEKIECPDDSDECYTGPDSDVASSPCFIFELDSVLDDKASKLMKSSPLMFLLIVSLYAMQFMPGI